MYSKKREAVSLLFFCAGDEPKSELAQDLGDRLQSRNAPSGASGDYPQIKRERSKTSLPILLYYNFIKRKPYYLAQPKEHLTALAQPAQISSL